MAPVGVGGRRSPGHSEPITDVMTGYRGASAVTSQDPRDSADRTAYAVVEQDETAIDHARAVETQIDIGQLGEQRPARSVIEAVGERVPVGASSGWRRCPAAAAFTAPGATR